MDFDLILEEIGEFGKFQLTNYLLICLPVLFAAANSLSYVFVARAPNYRCLVPECETTETAQYDTVWIQHAIPGTFSNPDGHFIPDVCQRYKIDNETTSHENDTCPAQWFSNEQIKCDKWVYDENEHTIVQDWDLTCNENQWKLALVGSMHFAGIIAGSGLFGFLADRYGRKIIFIVAIFFMSVTGVGMALAWSYISFLFFAFLNAVGTSGVYPLAFVIGVEMVGKGKREMSGVVLNYFYSIGEAIVGVIAWIDGDWINLQYLVSAPPVLFVAYYWIIPESIRWLLAKKRNTKAIKIIRRAARNNGVELSESILTKFEMEQADELEKNGGDINIKENNGRHHAKQRKAATFKELFKSKILLTRCLILFYIWSANALIFYGLSLNSTNLSGNIYLNFILACLIEIPGNTLAWVAMNKIGRRMSLTSSLLLCGVTCIAGGFIPEEWLWLKIVLFLTGKMGITSSFAIVYVYSAEMLPTLIRSSGVGTMSTLARFGALLAPFVPLLRFTFDFLPLLVFGAIAFLGGLLAVFLPETLGGKLPDTIEEAENIGKTQTNDI
ncbi:unnamed protein product [Diamesa tonsa]